MKNLVLIFLLFVMRSSVQAQLGITAASTQNQAIQWQVVPENFITHRRADFLRYGTSGVIDYVFPLKNQAIRLRPAMEVMVVNAIYHPHYFYARTVGLLGNIEFALWGSKDKQEETTPFIPYLQLSPGVSWVSLRYDRPKDDLNGVQEQSKSRTIAPSLGANIFLEFKLTELLTVAPTAGLRIYPNVVWEDFTEHVTDGTMTGTYDRSSFRQYSFGLRVGLNFNR